MLERISKADGATGAAHPVPAAPPLFVKKPVSGPQKAETTAPLHTGPHRPTPQEAARMAHFVYGDDPKTGASAGQLPAGWRPSALLVPGVVYAHPKGFFSALYERANADGTTSYAYATRGTDDGPDIGQDLRQPLGLKAEQYTLSVVNALKIKAVVQKTTGSDLYFVGHSLGGGLASANALATGYDAITFNAAGLSKATRRREHLADYGAYTATGGQIDAYVVAGEAVSRAQSVSPQLLLTLLRPLLQRDMPRLLTSATRHGLRAEGEIHELAIDRPLSGRNAQGEKNRFYRLPALPPTELAQLRATQSRLTRLLAKVPLDRIEPVRAALDFVNFFLGEKQSVDNHSMAVVERLIQESGASLPAH